MNADGPESRPALVMLLGAPRSGTTWLQAMLGTHPAIATPQETDVFHLYIGPLLETWERQAREITAPEQARRRKGLPLVLSEAQLVGATRVLLSSMLDAVHALKPDASVILEKTPAHSMCVEAILRVAPTTRFIHLVRDGRDVATSLVAAAQDGWGSSWAPLSIPRAGEVWRKHVLGARNASGMPGRYMELRYEALLDVDAAEQLQAVFDFCGVSGAPVDTRLLLADKRPDRSITKLPQSILTGGEAGDADTARLEPDGFVRTGGSGQWRELWSPAERRGFASVAGDLLVELGYEPDNDWVGRRQRPTPLARATHRIANSSARALRTFADAVERLPARSSRKAQP